MSNTDTTLGTLIEAKTRHRDNPQLTKLGHAMFELFSQEGLPPDMFMDALAARMELDLLQKVYITNVYQSDMLEHKRLAGAGEDNIAKARKQNVREIEALIRTGEIGAY